MPSYKLKKGLDLPIAGQPTQTIDDDVQVDRVAIIADDFPGMRPRMLVEEGQTVKRGQPIFEDRKTPGVFHTAPGAGRVKAIHRGARRALRSLVIELNEREAAGRPAGDDHAPFAAFTGKPVAELTDGDIVALMVQSGLWTALRTRPFSRVPGPSTRPAALFVNAMDSNPLAASPEVVIAERAEDFNRGLQALAKLCPFKTHLCVADGSPIAGQMDAPVELQTFSGPHPAGTTGVHIHLVAPAGRNRTVWSINYQDTIALGRLLADGVLDVSRVVAIGGPPVTRPRLLRTRLGADLEQLIHRAGALPAGALAGEQPACRLISGSVFSGKRAMGEVFGYLGRHHLQVSVLAEDRERRFLGWLAPGSKTFSIFPVFLSRWLGKKSGFDFSTNSNGSPRAMVPIGQFEKVMPMDVLPTFLLRSLAVGDIENAEKLGCLELDEEDLALCTFVDPGKTNWGVVLRSVLQQIQDEKA